MLSLRVLPSVVAENQNQDQRKRRWQRRGSTKTPETSAVQEREGDNETNVEQEDTRSAATLNQFVMPTKYITYDTVPKSHREDDTATRYVLLPLVQNSREL